MANADVSAANEEPENAHEEIRNPPLLPPATKKKEPKQNRKKRPSFKDDVKSKETNEKLGKKKNPVKSRYRDRNRRVRTDVKLKSEKRKQGKKTKQNSNGTENEP